MGIEVDYNLLSINSVLVFYSGSRADIWPRQVEASVYKSVRSSSVELLLQDSLAVSIIRVGLLLEGLLEILLRVPLIRASLL